MNIASPISSSQTLTCFQCNETSEKLKKCASCHTVPYCSRECQKAHWPEHKIVCKDFAKQDVEKKYKTIFYKTLDNLEDLWLSPKLDQDLDVCVKIVNEILRANTPEGKHLFQELLKAKIIEAEKDETLRRKKIAKKWKCLDKKLNRLSERTEQLKINPELPCDAEIQTRLNQFISST